jgi:putative ABC transport system substrate-binding protein
MRRRDVIGLLGVVITLCSTRSRAQQLPKKSLIGYLALAEIPYLTKAWKEGMRKLGYIEGHNIKVDRFIPTEGASADAVAAELVKRGPNVIVAVGTAMTVAAKGATATIPIVMAPVADPLRAGIVTNLAHPGGNITGTMLYGSELAGKRVDVFKQAVPGLARIAVLGAGASPVTRVLWPETQNAVQSLRLEARLFTVQDPDELSATFEAIAKDNANGMLVLADPMLNAARKTIIALATSHHLPAIYEDREFVQDGGLISYGPSIAEMTRRSSAFVDKILKGANPGELPIEQPTEYELVINLKTAKALGLTIPDKMLTVPTRSSNKTIRHHARLLNILRRPHARPGPFRSL